MREGRFLRGRGWFLLVLAYAALPVLGNLLGAVAAERWGASSRAMDVALHAALGVVLAVVGTELLPTTLELASPWVVLAGFVAGGLFFVLVDAATDYVRAMRGRGAGGGAGVPVFMASGLDVLSDGIMIGAASTLSPSLGLLLAFGQLPADVPEGFATNAAFKRSGMPAARRYAFLAGLAIPILVGASLGYFLLRSSPDAWKAAALAFTAGALATVLVEEFSPEVHGREGAAGGRESRLSALVFLGGFALFVALAALFET